MTILRRLMRKKRFFFISFNHASSIYLRNLQHYALLSLLGAIGNFFARLLASSEYNFLKMFAFSWGSNWIVPFPLREMFALFRSLACKQRDTIFRHSIGFLEF